MRICYIGDLSNIHTRRWVRFFGNSGHDVHVISTKSAETVELSNVKVYWLLTHRTGSYLMDLLLGFSSSPARVRKLRRLFREIHPDVVHIHYLNEAALFALLTGFRPLVLTAWGSDILLSPEKSWIRRQIVKYTLKRLNLMTCDADHMKQEMVSLGADPNKVKIIFFGTDVEKFDPERRDPGLRDQLTPGGAPTIISTRKLEPLYDVETFIRAIPIVRARFPQARVLIAGSGPLKEFLRELAWKLGLEDNVRFIGTLSEEQLPAYLTSSDVYVSTALSDAGIAASTAEAMACGVPVVITDVAANAQWVEDGKQGLLVRPRDAPMLGESIARLLESPALRARMGRAARQVIVERNNLRKEMLKMEGLYQELAKAKAMRGSPNPSPRPESKKRLELETTARTSANLLKRIFDIVFALLALVLLSPALCLFALLIKIDSRGPVLYRALRAGHYGKPFYMYKFRTMILNAEKPGGDTTALRDPRITRVGTFLRRYKIDELPQLFNVIKGEMSIVGPRPELPFYVQQYNETEQCILNVRPGITDLSSLAFHCLAEHVGAADPDHVFETQILPRKNQLRVKYATERSFLLDLRIIGATARAIARLLWQDLRQRVRTPALRVQLFTDRNFKR